MSTVERTQEPVSKMKARKRGINAEIKDLEILICQKKKQLREAKQRSEMLDRLIRAKTEEVTVSDHAVV